MDSILEVQNLSTHLYTNKGVIRAVDQVSFDIGKGEIFGLVGESGCGKTMTALSIMGLVPSPPGKIISGNVLLNDKELTSMPEKDLERTRGRDVSMIFQDPLASLDPLQKVGDQITETIRTHKQVGRGEAKEEAGKLLTAVGISDVDVRMSQYPFQMSGGMRQRVMIALAICSNPSLLIADEPSTNLDVTIQAQVLELIKSIRDKTGTAVLLITHNMGIVAWICDRVAIMYAGQIVESGRIQDVFKNPKHPYTRDLLKAVPRAKAIREPLNSIRGEVPDLTQLPSGCRYHPRCGYMKAVCQSTEPPIINSEGREVRCLMYDEELWSKGEVA
jgi:peptide/nickel transport system ATP-binding protein